MGRRTDLGRALEKVIKEIGLENIWYIDRWVYELDYCWRCHQLFHEEELKMVRIYSPQSRDGWERVCLGCVLEDDLINKYGSNQ